MNKFKESTTGEKDASIKLKTNEKVPTVFITSDNNSITLSWNKLENADSYEVLRSESLNGTYTSIESEITTNSYVDSGLTYGKTYYYKIKVCNDYNSCSGYSSIVNKKVVPKTPSIVLNSKNTKEVSVIMGSVNGADGYRVYRSTSKYGKYALVKELESDESSFDDTTKKNKTYYYR